MNLSSGREKDVSILRELAGRVAEAAALPMQKERLRLWTALNELRPIRPCRARRVRSRDGREVSGA